MQKCLALWQAEFTAEQEYLQTLSFLGPEEEKKFRERQGVQFLYMKPPGAGEEPLRGSQVFMQPGRKVVTPSHARGQVSMCLSTQFILTAHDPVLLVVSNNLLTIPIKVDFLDGPGPIATVMITSLPLFQVLTIDLALVSYSSSLLGLIHL